MDTTLHRTVNADNIFSHTFIDSKSLFMYRYHQAPCMIWVNRINREKVVDWLKEEYKARIRDIYEYSEWDAKKRKTEVYKTLLLMEEGFIIEAAYEYCQVLYLYGDQARAEALLRRVSKFKIREKKSRFSIELVMRDSDGLQLKTMDIKRTKLDLDLYYADGFGEVDASIRSRLNKKDDKGIVLLHGLPGAGKTTYLRHLVGRLKKKVLFLSPSAAHRLMEPKLLDLLMDHPNCIVVIEDAEEIVKDRKINSSSSVSHLLNISDGLLADVLHIQVICTFNQPLSMVDGALLRKGRLIAQYEFGRLPVEKAQRLSEHLGFETRIQRPMTIAEIAHQRDREYDVQRTQVIGFRQHAVVELS